MNDEIEESEEPIVSSLPEVASSCTFDMTMSEFNDIMNNTDICGALNQINLTDVVINGQTLEAVVYYSTAETDDTGIYVNGAKIAESANSLETHKLGIFYDMLFMTTINQESASFEVFDEDMAIIYSLEDALNSLQIEDPTFVALASTNSSINTVLSTAYIDGNSFSFTDGQVLFNSTSKLTCTAGSYSGSSYIITYEGSEFSAPTYTAGVVCQ